MSVWRDVQALAERRKQQGHWQAVRVLGLDGAYVLGWRRSIRSWWRLIWEQASRLQLGM